MEDIDKKDEFYIDFSKNKEAEKQYKELLLYMKKRYLEAIADEV